MDTQAFYQSVKGILEEQDRDFLEDALHTGQTEEVKRWKELATKLAWSIGTCFETSYGRQSSVRKFSLRLARVILSSRNGS